MYTDRPAASACSDSIPSYEIDIASGLAPGLTVKSYFTPLSHSRIAGNKGASQRIGEQLSLCDARLASVQDVSLLRFIINTRIFGDPGHPARLRVSGMFIALRFWAALRCDVLERAWTIGYR